MYISEAFLGRKLRDARAHAPVTRLMHLHQPLKSVLRLSEGWIVAPSVGSTTVFEKALSPCTAELQSFQNHPLALKYCEGQR